LEFCALVSSKICHDIISPVGAIANGLEIMEEEADESMREHAMALVKKSASTASAKLQFARLAFGAAGSAGAEIDLNEAEKVLRPIVETGKHTLVWNGPSATMAKDKVKLLLNLATIALDTLPRGGTIAVSITGEGDRVAFEVRCTGEKARIPGEFEELLNGESDRPLDAHSIQPFFTIRLAEAVGMPLSVSAEEGGVTLRAMTA
ncbi:MAG: histidine phosphotransferase, partial [Alphaproteobacteria bacterium]